VKRQRHGEVVFLLTNKDRQTIIRMTPDMYVKIYNSVKSEEEAISTCLCVFARSVYSELALGRP
jgi:hypothetical protein